MIQEGAPSGDLEFNIDADFEGQVDYFNGNPIFGQQKLTQYSTYAYVMG